MNIFNNKWFKIIRLFRLIFYIIFFLSFLIIPTSYFINNPSICIYAEKFHVLCPTCGVTRAFSSIMHFKYIDAFNYNSVFTLAFCPIFMYLFLDDFANIFYCLISKKERFSIMEYILCRYL